MSLAKWLRFLPSGGHRANGPDAACFRPRLERLEERNLLHAGHAIDIFRDAIVYSPGQFESFHFHPHLSIFIDGVQQVIPANIGLGPDGFRPTHTHDESGELHIESAVVGFQFQLDDFFANWGQTFNSQEILGHHADASHPITMTVNGQPSTLFGALPLAPFQQIVITLNGVP